jgi:hypothetical protein
MKIGAARLLGVALRVYRLSLLAYPRAFRREYGALLRQAFRDRLRAAAEHGAATMLWVCLAEFVDLAATSAMERRDAALTLLTRGALLRYPGLLLGALVGLLWLVFDVLAYATPAGDPGGFAEALPADLMLLAMPLAAALAGFLGGRRERVPTAGMREGVVAGLLGTAMMAAGIVALMLLWMPAIEATAHGDPGMMRDYYTSGTASFDAWLWRDNLGAATILGCFAALCGLVLGAAGGALGCLAACGPRSLGPRRAPGVPG